MKKSSWVGPLLVTFLLAWAGLTLAQNSSGGAFVPNFNYVVSGQWTWRTVNPWVIEGATDDPYETTITFDEPTTDTTLTIPNGGAASASLLVSALTTNDVDVVNSIWGVSNGLRFEGATANAFETTLSPTDVGGDITLTLPGLGNASGAVLASTLTTNDVGAANSVWGVSNGLTFEGASADAGELFLTVANIATASRTMTLPDMGAASAVLASTLTTNAADAANSVWGISGGLMFEGSGADGNEITIQAANAAADVIYEFRSDLADTYHPLAIPDADVTGGYWQIPEYGAADADLTMTDNTLYVYRVYLPTYLTIANIRLRATQGAQVAGTDDILGVAIYEDTDAGAALVTGSTADVTATGDFTINNTDATLGPGFYRVAVCSGDGDGAAFVGDTVDDEFIDVANLGAVTIGTGANACVAGVPPATTGALTTADINIPVLKFGA